MKNRKIIYLGLLAIVALYAYDQSTKTEMILPATVAGVSSEVADKGPDIWLITVTFDGAEVTLEPRASRPDVTTGDRICVTEMVRQGQPSEYLWAPESTC